MLVQRVYEVHPMVCPQCSAQMTGAATTLIDKPVANNRPDAQFEIGRPEESISYALTWDDLTKASQDGIML